MKKIAISVLVAILFFLTLTATAGEEREVAIRNLAVGESFDLSIVLMGTDKELCVIRVERKEKGYRCTIFKPFAVHFWENGLEGFYSGYKEAGSELFQTADETVDAIETIINPPPEKPGDRDV